MNARKYIGGGVADVQPADPVREKAARQPAGTQEQDRGEERGDHEELLKQKGTYYQLYTGAFELD